MFGHHGSFMEYDGDFMNLDDLFGHGNSYGSFRSQDTFFGQGHFKQHFDSHHKHHNNARNPHQQKTTTYAKYTTT